MSVLPTRIEAIEEEIRELQLRVLRMEIYWKVAIAELSITMPVLFVILFQVLKI